MSDSFIELRFGQCEDIQREIVPVFSIDSVYVDMLDQKSIVFTWTINDRTFKRKEYFENEWQCNRRWYEIEKILGVNEQVMHGKGQPIPVSSDEWGKYSAEYCRELRTRMIHSCHPPREEEQA